MFHGSSSGHASENDGKDLSVAAGGHHPSSPTKRRRAAWRQIIPNDASDSSGSTIGGKMTSNGRYSVHSVGTPDRRATGLHVRRRPNPSGGGGSVSGSVGGGGLSRSTTKLALLLATTAAVGIGSNLLITYASTVITAESGAERSDLPLVKRRRSSAIAAAPVLGERRLNSRNDRTTATEGHAAADDAVHSWPGRNKSPGDGKGKGEELNANTRHYRGRNSTGSLGISWEDRAVKTSLGIGRAAEAYYRLIQIGATVREKIAMVTVDNNAAAASYVSGMGQNEEYVEFEDEKKHKSEEQRSWIHHPDPNAFTSDGKIDKDQRQAAWTETCVPMQEWQSTFHPTCNSIHEHDLISTTNEVDTSLLSSGGSWRMAWKIRPKSDFLRMEEAGGQADLVQLYNSIPNLLPPKQKRTITNLTCTNLGNATFLNVSCANVTYTVDAPSAESSTEIDDSDYGHSSVLKMLRIDRDYNPETYRYHTTDAIALERLTKSPYVVNAYGFCGESALTELGQGSGRDLIKRTDLEPRKRLRMARNLAQGLADIHGIDDETGRNATFVHNDINLANLALVSSSSIKFNDFNIGMKSRWDREKDRPCGHPVLFESPLWRAPEEIRNEGYVNEKVDVYSLGNVLFQVLTKHQPWTWLEVDGRPTLEQVAKKKMRGELPYIPAKYTESTNMATQALYIATLLCYTFDPEKRPSARSLSRSLSVAYIAFSQFRRGKRKELTFDDLLEIFDLQHI